MFNRFPKISEIAAKDVAEYISLFWTEGAARNQKLHDCFNSVFSFDNVFWNDSKIVDNVPEFISQLLHWLEQNRDKNKNLFSKQGRKFKLADPRITVFF